MRYATVLLSWDEGQLHPIDDAVAAAPDVRIEATDYINPIGDGTYVELSRLRGEPERIREVLDGVPEVLEHEVPDGDDGVTYVHYEATPLMDEMLDVVFEHAVVLQWPVEFLDDAPGRRMRITVVGTDEALVRTTDAIPDGIGVELERIGDYVAAMSHPATSLTAAQRELLETAIEAGYYDVPREATQRDIADELGVTPGTISDRLHRIESTLLRSIVASDR